MSTRKALVVSMVELFEQILPKVSKPSRYLGGEWNSVVKSPHQRLLSFALAFPDTYEIGMSNLGLQILYQILNQREDTRAERIFAPWIDMEAHLRARKLPLCSLETFSPMASFDVIGFSLQHELNYTNALNMLELGKIPLLAGERQNSLFPLICAGGPCTVNPEPLADFFDFFFIGEAEEAIHDIVEICWRGKRGKYASKRDLLLALAQIEGVYVPEFYQTDYEGPSGSFSGISPSLEGVPERIRKRAVRDLNGVPVGERPVVPYMQVAQDRVAVEIARGCGRGCRFCQAGYAQRPPRQRDAEIVVEEALQALRNTGHETLSLLALNCPDHPQLEDIVRALQAPLSRQAVSLSFPSTRVDSFPTKLMLEASPGKRTGLTLAPEAGSERLREVIHKGVSRDQLLEVTETAFEAGWRTIKLYYMIGLPTETEEDLKAIGEEVAEVVACGKRKGKYPQINLSIATMVPKPHTAFQWEEQLPLSEIERRQRLVLKELRGRGIKVNWHDGRQTEIESLLSRADRRLGRALLQARNLGICFDAWTDCFDYDRWQKALSQGQIHPEDYLRGRAEGETLPWDHIDVGVSKDFLLRERARALGEMSLLTSLQAS